MTASARGAAGDAAAIEITRAIRRGDADALASLYRDWFDRMYADAKRATGRGEDFCLDVVHDAMLRVIRALPALESQEHLGRWLLCAVRSCAYDRLRRETRARRRETRRATPGGAGSGRGASAEPSAETHAEIEERLAWLRSRLAAMDGRSLDLITMRHRFGWSLARIGAALGLKTGAVDGRIGRIMDDLRASADDPRGGTRPAPAGESPEEATDDRP